MDSSDLTPEQIAALIERLTPTLGYLTKLGERMDRRGFAGDSVRDKVSTAKNAMQDLVMTLRYVNTPGTGSHR